MSSNGLFAGIEALVERLNQVLAGLGVELKSGQIIDATFGNFKK